MLKNEQKRDVVALLLNKERGCLLKCKLQQEKGMDKTFLIILSIP
ncbi:MAG: hypothetical protein WC136_00610 [Sphaerochaeta sp.]